MTCLGRDFRRENERPGSMQDQAPDTDFSPRFSEFKTRRMSDLDVFVVPPKSAAVLWAERFCIRKIRKQGDIIRYRMALWDIIATQQT